MPRTVIPVNSLVGNPVGIAPVVEVAADISVDPNGNSIPSYGNHMWLEATCTVAGPVLITFKTPSTVAGRAIADDVATMSGVGTKRRFGPFDKDVYGDELQINCNVVGVTFAAYQTVEP